MEFYNHNQSNPESTRCAFGTTTDNQVLQRNNRTQTTQH